MKALAPSIVTKFDLRVIIYAMTHTQKLVAYWVDKLSILSEWITKVLAKSHIGFLLGEIELYK